MTDISEMVGCLIQAVDTMNQEDMLFSQHSVEQVLKAYFVEREQPELPIAVYQFYDRLLRGGPSLLVALESLERRLDLKSRGANYLHSHMLINRGTVEAAAESANMPQDIFSKLLEDSSMYPDEYQRLPWPRELDFGDTANYLVLKQGELPRRTIAQQDFMRTYLWHVAHHPKNMRTTVEGEERPVYSRMARYMGVSRFGLQKMLMKQSPLAPSGEYFERNSNCRGSPPTREEILSQFNKIYAVRALEISEGNVTRAARFAGMSRFGFQKTARNAGIPRGRPGRHEPSTTILDTTI